MVKQTGKIDNLRARLMLNMESEKLQKILQYEKTMQDQTDHLPLRVLKKKFAMILPNSPEKVTFK